MSYTRCDWQMGICDKKYWGTESQRLDALKRLLINRSVSAQTDMHMMS